MIGVCVCVSRAWFTFIQYVHVTGSHYTIAIWHHATTFQRNLFPTPAWDSVTVVHRFPASPHYIMAYNSAMYVILTRHTLSLYSTAGTRPVVWVCVCLFAVVVWLFVRKTAVVCIRFFVCLFRWNWVSILGSYYRWCSNLSENRERPLTILFTLCWFLCAVHVEGSVVVLLSLRQHMWREMYLVCLSLCFFAHLRLAGDTNSFRATIARQNKKAIFLKDSLLNCMALITSEKVNKLK